MTREWIKVLFPLSLVNSHRFAVLSIGRVCELESFLLTYGKPCLQESSGCAVLRGAEAGPYGWPAEGFLHLFAPSAPSLALLALGKKGKNGT